VPRFIVPAGPAVRRQISTDPKRATSWRAVDYERRSCGHRQFQRGGAISLDRRWLGRSARHEWRSSSAESHPLMGQPLERARSARHMNSIAQASRVVTNYQREIGPVCSGQDRRASTAKKTGAAQLSKSSLLVRANVAQPVLRLRFQVVDERGP
jgi:hypothetical protein